MVTGCQLKLSTGPAAAWMKAARTGAELPVRALGGSITKSMEHQDVRDAQHLHVYDMRTEALPFSQ